MSLHSRSTRLIAAASAVALSTGCASTTVIHSDPEGATLYIDGSKVGRTPYTYSDTKTLGATTRIQLRKDGYEDFETVMTRNEQFQADACIGGVFFFIPYLWVMGYNPERNFELTPIQGDPAMLQPMYPEQPYPQQPMEPQQQPMEPPPPPPPAPNL